MENNIDKKKYHLQKLYSAISSNLITEKIDKDKAWANILKNKRRHQIRKYAQYAAAIILPLIFLFLWNFNGQKENFLEETIVSTGQKKAILTLESGEQQFLTSEEYKIPELAININSSQRPNQQITIPRGGEFKIILSDGTIVWLNSETEISYPVQFDNKERRVKIEGEAFFEVAKDTGKPFIVTLDQYDVIVTGTRFNIRNYDNEPLTTTLIDGSVNILYDTVMKKLNPGEQAYLSDNNLEIKIVDIEESMAWMNDLFIFKEKRLEILMNDIARWYDIEVIYMNDDIKNYHFTATFQRTSTINEVIEVLEKTKKIKLNINANTLIVSETTRI